MNRKSANYKFDDIIIGLTKEFSIEITESMINNFAEFSGDYNELHMDENYASTTKFGKRICHGMLLASFFSRLVECQFRVKMRFIFLKVSIFNLHVLLEIKF